MPGTWTSMGTTTVPRDGYYDLIVDYSIGSGAAGNVNEQILSRLVVGGVASSAASALAPDPGAPAPNKGLIAYLGAGPFTAGQTIDFQVNGTCGNSGNTRPITAVTLYVRFVPTSAYPR